MHIMVTSENTYFVEQIGRDQEKRELEIRAEGIRKVGESDKTDCRRRPLPATVIS